MSDAGERDSIGQRLRENAVTMVSTLVTAIWLGAMFTGQSWWLAAMLVGYVAVVPITAILFGDEEDRAEWLDRDSEAESVDSAADEEETPLETLRRRYAEGELSEAQFERKLDQLLETETMEDAEAYASRADREQAVERER
ncbi:MULTISPECIES: SHOCT domain-containing protein [Halolamina]|uniref:Short C-terminal domain-containing protein n=1 Tax=Halolamina pelagica TaxID=699431 RepID=A0A1I5M8X9_9EURY|nr:MULTISPECIES: SHOCT domain-containing protein [Halolamina]NHX35919.1 SHOCT domain-containing protein [Halolamina sp. R1-12]SFP05980.1 Short C-terminal domain-containing protein [Halolamina pelagica]